ncbi:MAG: trypsin-like peptidase domain-containing protein [Lachnospiraceae bacterium]|nr:trypsin-like peptidase domain-containing protein [Lachnospiraceae bacterium]
MIACGIYFVSGLLGRSGSVQTVSVTETDTVTASGTEAVGETGAGSEAGTDAGGGADVGSETGTVSETGADVDSETGTDGGNGSDAGNNAESETGVDLGNAADAETGTEAQAEDDEEPDMDISGASDEEGGSGALPDGGSISAGAFGQEDSLDIVGVVKKTMPSVVAITNQSVQEVTYMFRGTEEIEIESSGTGIIIGENDTELLIATNYHVVEDASILTVCFWADVEDEEDLIVEAALKGLNESKDLAVIAVQLEAIADEVRDQIYAATLGTSGTLIIGEPAIAIGNALGYGQSVTYGIISALDRTIEVDGVTGVYIQTDAAINAGNSGGALLNSDGEVIGINSAKVSASGVEGMGYAIPIDDARPVLTKLMERTTREKVAEEERGYLGIFTQDISEETRSLYNIPNGVYVSMVESDSPAEDAGMKQGDIISSLDGVTVTSADGFESLLTYYSVGETVEIEFYRADKGSYEAQTLSVTFSEQPQEESSSDERFTPPFGGMTPFR